MNILSEIKKAEKRIRPYILKTPLIPSNFLSKLNKGKVYLKMESEQYTGSFKVRGAMNKILSLSEQEKKKGIVTASTGNHALGVARALSITGIKGTIFLPENAETSKIEALRGYNATLEFYGKDFLATELHAKQVAKEKGASWISPYNDPQIIGGQGTIGIEIVQQLDKIDYVLATVGGGGLISGVATYLKSVSPETKIIGCLPINFPKMYLSVKAGKIVSPSNLKETLSDGSAGGIEEGSITFPICQQLIDDFILVSEKEIKEAIKLIVDKHHKIIEGAAAVSVASFIKNKEKFKGANVVIIICGGNIATSKLKALL
ncbi:threonine/serine dehydratase [Patescibacteria group bacterium]|nr:threonine/serine dehydratase [Patescibacteria group bacterium]MBU2633461.1 threonine/serine dehydratase [Patescibacteria group bacterium]